MMRCSLQSLPLFLLTPASSSAFRASSWSDLETPRRRRRSKTRIKGRKEMDEGSAAITDIVPIRGERKYLRSREVTTFHSQAVVGVLFAPRMIIAEWNFFLEGRAGVKIVGVVCSPRNCTATLSTLARCRCNRQRALFSVISYTWALCSTRDGSRSFPCIAIDNG